MCSCTHCPGGERGRLHDNKPRPAATQANDATARHRQLRHVFRGELTVPLDQLKLREGQDLRLASLEELRSERIWSDQCLERRPIAPGLNIVMRHLLAEMHDT